MSRTTILLGPPGTGKTTSLLEMVDKEIAQGTPPERIGYFAFTRRAAREAVSRAVTKFGCAEEDLPWFRTLHSAAFRILGLHGSEVMQNVHYDELGNALGFTFEHSYDETTERVPMGGALGDRCLAIYDRARARMQSVTDEWRATHGPGVTLFDALRFADALELFKRTFQLLMFSDFLDEVHEPIDLDVMIIDEAQDLTLQQWAFARRIGAKAKRVIIAGDDDQAIFQWAGSDLRYFLELAGTVHVLPHSHRLPRSVWQVADGLAGRIRVRYPKQWAPRPEQGALHHLDSADQVALRDGKQWLLLTRSVYQLEHLRRVCRDQGVVYQDQNGWSNRTPAVRAVLAYEHMRRGETVSARAVAGALRFIPGMGEIRVSQPLYTWDDIDWPFEGKPDWMAALTGIGGEQREYIRRLRREGESLVDPGRVVLSTIHGVKGGEADNVLLLPNVPRRVYDAMHYDPDQETRVWYVGASRAREALHLVRPTTTKFFSI